ITLLAPLAASEQTLREKMTPPLDSLDREYLRIWIPAERPSACRLSIKILDSANQVVRHLVDYVAPGGYLNFYWDKKDDSGKLVEPGRYRFEADDCGQIRDGQLKVRYRKWERESRVKFYDDSTGFFLELQEDSADVKVEWYNMKRRMVGRFYMGTDLKKGKYNFNWNQSKDDSSYAMLIELNPGLYVQKVLVGEYFFIDTVRFYHYNE
ncbi:MAG TPA: FlgD immunoglobulin-like domain containing protein, partial [candidate division Zixibacteria bacterium]|nr:FlgD immunoglobulin-like domain containing protein [candidate division Zixibacteria bacterium]